MLFPQSVHCFLIFLFYQKSHFYLRKSHISIFAETRVWTGDDGENRTYGSEATLCPTVSAWPSEHLFTKVSLSSPFAFLPFEVQNHYPQYSLATSAEDGI